MIEFVRLLNEAHIKTFWDAIATQYTYDIMTSLDLNGTEADAKSRRDMNEDLELGFFAPGNYFLSSRNTTTRESVGAVWVVLEEEIRTAWLQYLLVYPQYRGQGLGTEMLRSLSAWARKMGCDQVNLTVYAHNSVARNLYRKSGFQCFGEIMRLSLTGR